MSPSSAGPSILLLGDGSADEMQPVVRCVETIPGKRRTAETIADLRRLIEVESWHPDLIVVLQTWSDQFPASEVGELLTLAPLTRIVCVYGAWCDSDGRTRDHWPLAVRVPVSFAMSRITRELAVIAGRVEPSGFGVLPLTASRGEIFAADFGEAPSPAADSGRVAVLSPDRALRGMLKRTLRAAGRQVVEPSAVPPPDALIWDADQGGNDRTDELARLREGLPTTRLIAAVGFPRPELTRDLLRAGADSEWFKLAPHLNDE